MLKMGMLNGYTVIFLTQLDLFSFLHQLRWPIRVRLFLQHFQSVVLEIGFQSSAHDSASFIRHTSNVIILLLLYVDDIIITESDASAIFEVK